jgi:hypothetical protein
MSKIPQIPLISLIARLFTHNFLLLLFPLEIDDKKKILTRVNREVGKEGRGLIVVYTHFSYRDGIELTRHLVIKNPLLQRREVISPLSFHQYNGPVKFLTNLYHEKLYPIVNNDTLVRKGFEHMRKGEGMDKFINASALELKRGGIVMIATNAGRKEKLDIDDTQKPLGYLMLGLQQKKIDNYGILIVCLTIKGAKSYKKKDVGGVNIGKTYILTPAAYYHPDELLAKKEVGGKISNVDAFVRRDIAKVAAAEYL